MVLMEYSREVNNGIYNIEFQEAFLNDYFSLEVHDTDSSDLSVQIICSSKIMSTRMMCACLKIHFNSQLSHYFLFQKLYTHPLGRLTALT